MLKPWIDAMSVNPSGGHALFPEGNPPVSQNIPPSNTFLTEGSSKHTTSSGSQTGGGSEQEAASRGLGTSSEAPGATSQSPTGSQGSDSPGNFSVDSEKEFQELEPIIYKEVYVCFSKKFYVIVLNIDYTTGEFNPFGIYTTVKGTYTCIPVDPSIFN